MGSADNRTDYEAILIPDYRITQASIWAAESTYTEDDPQAGPITNDSGDGDSECVIQASGEPVLGTALRIRALHPGMPGVNRAGFAWRPHASTGDYYGWNVPSSIMGYEGVSDATSAASGNYGASVVALANGTLVLASGYFDATTRAIRIATRAWGGSWSGWTTLTTETTTTGHMEPRLLLLPSGRILLYAFTFDDANAQYQIAMWYSNDGTTWVLGAPAVMPNPLFHLGFAPTRLRVAYNPVNAHVVLLYEYAAGLVKQFASRDIGCSFIQVATAMALTAHEIVVVDGTFILGYPGAGSLLGIKRTGSAFTSLDTITGALVTAVTVSATELLLVPFGSAVYAYGITAGLGWAVSSDGGLTWLLGAGTTGVQWAAGGIDIARHSGCAHRGRVVIIGNQTAPAANVNALTMLVMGGYASVTLPPERKDQNVGKQSWWTNAWVGHVAPATYMTDTSVGVPVVTRNANGSWNVAAAFGVTASYDAPSVGTTTELIAECSVIVNNSGVFRLLLAEGTGNTELEVRITGASPTTIGLWDVVAGTQIGSDITGITQGSRIDLLAAISVRNGRAWYRVYSSDSPRTWLEVEDTSTLTVGATTSRVRMTVTLGDADLFSEWHLAAGVTVVGVPTTIGNSLADGQSNPSGLFAHPLPASTPAYVNDGVSIRGLDGPMLVGEAFNLEITHPYPIEAMIPAVQPSPRARWQAAAATADMSIAFELAAAAVDTHVGQDSIGLYLGSCNVHKLRLRGYDQGVGWTTLATIDRGSNVEFLRFGHTLTPAISGSAVNGTYMARDELAGGYVLFVTGGLVRTIVGNTEGSWDNGAIDEKRPVIFLDQTEMTGAEATSGTISIVYPDTLTTVNLLGVNKYRAYQLLLSYTGSAAIAPPGGKFKIGVCVLGPMIVLGKPAERRVVHSYEPRVSTQEYPDGTTRTRVIAGTRRTVQIPLGVVDISTARPGAYPGSNADPDYVAGSTTALAEPLAHRRDLPLMLEGLCKQLDGSHTPVVWVPRWLRGGAIGNALTFYGQTVGMLYGRITGWPSYTQAGLGKLHESEVMQLGPLTIREEV